MNLYAVLDFTVPRLKRGLFLAPGGVRNMRNSFPHPVIRGT